MPTELRNFLAIPYDELEEMNLNAKEQRKNRVAPHKIQEERIEYLTEEKRIKAVTVLFSDLEGRLHMLDYDKKFLIKSWDNLTFDGSSIRGFTAQRESDLRLGIDWRAFYWGPADVFGPGKVLVFGDVIDKGGTPYSADIRGILKTYAEGLYKKHGYTLNAANEIEGFLFQGPDAERRLSRNPQIRVCKHWRLLSFAARGCAAHFHRHHGGSAARDGIPERKRSPRSGTLAVRDQLWLRRSRSCGRSDSDLQTDLPSGRDQDGLHCVVPAQASGGGERQRDAYQCLDQQRREEPVLGCKGRREAEQNGLGVHRSHSHSRQRSLPAAQSPASMLIGVWTRTLRRRTRSRLRRQIGDR